MMIVWPSLPRCVERLHHRRLGRIVERAGRLVEDQHRRLLVDRAGDAEPLALAPGQADAAFADMRFVAVGQAGRRTRRAAPCAVSSTCSQSIASSGPPNAMLRAMRVSARKIACGTCAMLRCQRRRLSRSSATPSTVIRPALGSSSPMRRSASVLLPLPVWPISPTVVPRGMSSVTRRGRGRGGRDK